MTTLGSHLMPVEEEEEIDESFGNEFLLNTMSVTHEQYLTNTQHIVLANQELVNKHWILLDNQSTIHIFKWDKMLTKTREVENGVRCYCNGGY